MANPNQGKPPKTAVSIRASLESIHRSAEKTAHAGPLVDGFSGAYPIAVATFFDREVARSLQQLLSQSGIFSKIVPGGQGASVFVDNDDHDRAAQLYREHQERFPNRIPRKQSRRFDFLIFGIAIGITIGMIIAAGVKDFQDAIAIPITFTAIGAAVGHLLDRGRTGFYRTGRIRVGVLDLLITMSIIGMMMVAIGFVRELLQP